MSPFIELKGLDGKTAFLQDAPLDLVQLRARIAQHVGVPSHYLRLTSSGRELHDSTMLASGCSVHVLLRLVGGKGGFGAMLRTAGARGVKTTNFDACRDLNGRRLRHVNAEANLREWDMQAAQRELKKQEDQAKRGKNGELSEARIAHFDDEAYDDMLKVARNRVTDALADSFNNELATFSHSTHPFAGASASSSTSAVRPQVNCGTASALGKRGAKDPEETISIASSSPRKAAKLNAAFDPLAVLGGSDEECSSDAE